MVMGLLYLLAVVIGLCLLIVPGIIVSMGFAMAPLIQGENPNISGVDALQMSWNMMNGHKWEFFVLNLRFIGWILLGILTCGILYLWVTPYMTAAYINFYKQLRYNTY